MKDRVKSFDDMSHKTFGSCRQGPERTFATVLFGAGLKVNHRDRFVKDDGERLRLRNHLMLNDLT